MKGKINLLTLALFMMLAGYVEGSEEQSESVFNVRDFGAVGDGVHDDSRAFDKAKSAAIQYGPGATILIPEGNYVLSKISDARVDWTYPISEELAGRSLFIQDSGHWTFANVEGLHIRGLPGSTILLSHPDEAGIVFLRCRNIRVEGIAVDYDPLPFTQGTVLDIDRSSNTFRVQIDSGFPEPDVVYFGSSEEKLQARRFYLMDHETGDFIRDIPPFDIDSIEREGDEFVLDSRRKILDQWEGKRFVMIARRPKHTFRLIDTGGFVFDGVTVYSAPAQAYNEMTGPGGNQYIGCQVLPKGNRLMSVNADAFFSKRMRLGPELRGCRFEKMDDDGGNIGSTNLRVLAQPSDDTILMDLKNNHLVEDGDHFQLTNGSTGEVKQNVRVQSTKIVQWRDRYALEVKMDQALEISHTVDSLSASSDYGPPVKSKGAVTEDSVPDLALNLDTICEGLVIEDCHIKDSRVRGFRLYTKSAKILNNHFENLAKPGISLGQSLSWFEGPSSADTLIQGNTFTKVRSTNIYIGDFSVSIEPLDIIDNQRIQIIGNRFEDYGGPFADGRKYLELLLSTAVIVRNACDVTIKDNEFFPSEDAPQLEPVIVDSETTSAITIEGNQFKGNPWSL